jgi:uncharacterized membrane protein (DUF2068 family)
MNVNMKKKSTIKAIAIFEFLKGLMILLSTLAIIIASNHKLLSYFSPFIKHIYFPSIAIFIFRKVVVYIYGNINREYFLLSFSTAYSLLRFLEAYGLWNLKKWGYLIGIISVSLYLPIEIVEIIKNFAFYKIFITGFNVAILIYLIKIRK